MQLQEYSPAVYGGPRCTFEDVSVTGNDDIDEVDDEVDDDNECDNSVIFRTCLVVVVFFIFFLKLSAISAVNENQCHANP